MRKIAIANRKGGTAKTTSAVNIAAALALAGNTVLLIDTDTQGHCSKLLGIQHQKTLADVIEGQYTATEAIIQARERLHFIPGGPEIAGAKNIISKLDYGRESVLSKALQPVEGMFDYVLFDTAPGFDEISINVLFYCRELIIPVSMEALAVGGFMAFLDEIEAMQEYTDIEVKYIIPTFYDRRVKKSDVIYEGLKARFPDLVTFPISYNVSLSESPAKGQTIFEYAPRDRGAIDYAKVAGMIS